MACRLFGTKPLPKPMLAHYQLVSWEQISVKLESKFYHFHSRKCIWNYRLPKGWPVCPGGDELKGIEMLPWRHWSNQRWYVQIALYNNTSYIDGILPKGPYPPCLRMANRALLAGYHRYILRQTKNCEHEFLDQSYILSGLKWVNIRKLAMFRK